VGVFERHRAGRVAIAAARREAAVERGERRQAVRGRQRARLDAADRRRGAELEEDDVGALVDQQFVTSRADQSHTDLVAHDPRRHEERRLVAERLGGLLFQPPYRRVLAVDVVADLRLRHRPAHRGVGAGQRVGPQVDDLHAPQPSAARPAAGAAG
jgi:hypothetical protein